VVGRSPLTNGDPPEQAIHRQGNAQFYWGSALIRKVQYSPAADQSGAARVTGSDGGPAPACGGTL